MKILNTGSRFSGYWKKTQNVFFKWCRKKAKYWRLKLADINILNCWWSKGVREEFLHEEYNLGDTDLTICTLRDNKERIKAFDKWRQILKKKVYSTPATKNDSQGKKKQVCSQSPWHKRLSGTYELQDPYVKKKIKTEIKRNFDCMQQKLKITIVAPTLQIKHSRHLFLSHASQVALVASLTNSSSAAPLRPPSDTSWSRRRRRWPGPTSAGIRPPGTRGPCSLCFERIRRSLRPASRINWIWKHGCATGPVASMEWTGAEKARETEDVSKRRRWPKLMGSLKTVLSIRSPGAPTAPTLRGMKTGQGMRARVKVMHLLLRSHSLSLYILRAMSLPHQHIFFIFIIFIILF